MSQRDAALGDESAELVGFAVDVAALDAAAGQPHRGNQAQLVRRLGELIASGVRAICLLALSDSGIPCYDEALARKLSALGIPCFGCTPQRLPDLLEGALKGADLKALAARVTAKS